ncbi:hypothetical protein [Sandarakinorhabdus sp. DWP1-3-1]|uniref:hypothetical protein n=1 Tax=Sandarakinorhabdus sp. DWP1-3-1 TaxID=2804627 RepID=UPI003CFA00D4
MSLLGGGLAQIFGAAFGSIYLPATLHRRQAPTYDAGGSVVAGAGFADVSCRAQVEAAGYAMRSAEGFVDGDVRILILSATLAGAVTTDDEVTVSGKRWLIASVASDPAASYWDLRGRAA